MKHYNALLLCLYHPWSYRGGNPLLVLYLADRTTVEVEWQVSLMRLGLIPLLVHRWIDLRNWIDDKWLNMRHGGVIRRKGRIPDGKGGKWCVFMFGALNVIVLACVDYGLCRLGPDEQASIMY
jgi:hypothetical protein